MISRIVVVLPAPDGPTMPRIVPGGHLEVEVEHADALAVVAAGAAQTLDGRGRRRERAGRRDAGPRAAGARGRAGLRRALRGRGHWLRRPSASLPDGRG